MGLCHSTPVKDQEDPSDPSRVLVGPTARFNNKIENLDKISEKRKEMAALEILSEVETVYYKRDQKYPSEGGLNFHKDKLTYLTRMLLEEPIGRFYLSEFCAKEANYSLAVPCVQIWSHVATLYKKELNIDDAVRLHKAEQDAEKQDETVSVAHGEKRLDTMALKFNYTLTINKAVVNEDYHRLAEENIKAAVGFVKQLPSDDMILSSAKQVYTLITEESLAKAFKEIDPAAFDAYVQLYESESPEISLLLENMTKMKVTAFKVIEQSKVVTDFQHRSHYQRYIRKFSKVYNSISHRDFDFMQTLGKGSFGRVIRVRKKTTQKQYALKVMSKKKILNGAENKEQVTIEKQVLLLCEFCPFVVTLHFGFQTTKALFIALQLLEGGTLTDAMYRPSQVKNEEPVEVESQETTYMTETLRRDGNGEPKEGKSPKASCWGLGATGSEGFKKRKLSPNQVRIMAAQIIMGLNHLHMHGLLYRDLKPVNVMLDADGCAVLTDMGLCAKSKRSIFEKRLGIRPRVSKKSKAKDAEAPNPESEVEEDFDLDEEKVLPYHITEEDITQISSLYKDKHIKHMSLLTKRELKCVGTAGFRSPELLSISSSRDFKKLEKLKNKKGKQDVLAKYNRSGYGYEVDYWALGITLYYLLKTNYPFRNRSKISALNPFGGAGMAPDMKQAEIMEQRHKPNWEKEFPDDPHLTDFLKNLLHQDPKKRYGHDIKTLQRHPFFTMFDYKNDRYFDSKDQAHDPTKLWTDFANKKIEPVYKPKVRKHEADEKPKYNSLSEAMRHFRQEQVLELFGGGENDMVDDFRNVQDKYQVLFEEWDYIPNKLLKEDWEMVAEYFRVDSTS